jgi:hypothetical protein
VKDWLWTAAASWAAVALAHFFGSWLATWLWLLGLFLMGMLWVTALWATTTAIVVARRRGAVAAVGTGLVAALIATTIVLTDWTGAFARSWFWLHRGEFVAAEQLARSGALGPPETWDYYGVELPFGLRALSVDGHISEIGRAGGAPVLFVPAYMGIPDDAYGFVHLVGAVEAGTSTATAIRSSRASRWGTGGGGPTRVLDPAPTHARRVPGSCDDE